MQIASGGIILTNVHIHLFRPERRSRAVSENQTRILRIYADFYFVEIRVIRVKEFANPHLRYESRRLSLTP